MQMMPWVLLATLAAFALTVRKLLQLREERVRLQTTLGALEKSKEETRGILEGRKTDLEMKLRAVEIERLELANRVAAFEEAEEMAQDHYREQVSQVTFLLQTQQEKEKRAEADKEAAEARRLSALKQTWLRHEASVEQKLKQLCQKLAIEYVGKEAFPHKGAPDNCIKICGEFIVFDCKSPQGEDFSYFPTYIKAQADAAEKYTKADDVARDLYFVVPRSAIECLETLFWDLAGYRVHLITPDALEPILIARQQLEGYELAGKLDPADREKICLMLGKMAHGLKRRIQVDQYFNKEFMSLLLQTQSLPTAIVEEASRIEKASKLNPPNAKRAKAIDIGELQSTGQHLKQVAEGLEIDTQGQVEISASK